jgi:hypothetical protein
MKGRHVFGDIEHGICRHQALLVSLLLHNIADKAVQFKSVRTWEYESDFAVPFKPFGAERSVAIFKSALSLADDPRRSQCW